MKKQRSVRQQNRGRKLAGTVSAAALMLGVSQAATVGFNFQCNYCAVPSSSYSGAVVTAPAFGIGTNRWESLTQMGTGYGCPAAYYTLSQVVDTTTAAGGLNPLPRGSVTVNWSAYTSNVSGFGGYSRSGPHYNFDGPLYKPGNEQVYWGFLRDGVNDGPGSSGGNNNQPGYSIDLVGLKSLFTNSPFVVQLIASSDSMQVLTNAFVIDATGGTTQSVIYPSTPLVADAGAGYWISGRGGGLSTMTTNALDTDHVKIIGNRAAHWVDNFNGYNFASTIAGFIVTDQPVVTMSPRSLLVCGGDALTLNPYAIGVPPLSYQWRLNGVPIPGATSVNYHLASVAVANAGDYDLIVTNLYGSATSAVASVTVDQLGLASGQNYVLDSNTANPENDGLAVGGATWAATSGSRSGVMSFGSPSTGQITVPPATNLNSVTGTILFWMRSSGLLNSNGPPATLFNRLSGAPGASGTQGLAISQRYGGVGQIDVDDQTFTGTSTFNLSDNNWHLVAVSYDRSIDGSISYYVDGVLDNLVNGPWFWPVAQQIELARSHDTTNYQAYSGLLDDVRIYNRILTPNEIFSIYSTGALVDTNALVLRLNFDAAPTTGITLKWLCPDATLEAADVVTGPYTDLPTAVSGYNAAARNSRKFYRYKRIGAPLVSNPYLM